jgi:steroid 5-alpha reductase family enzyme
MNRKTGLLILLSAIILASIFLFSSTWPFVNGFLLIISVLTGLWLYSLLIKNASIIDIFWGLGFAILAWFYNYTLQNFTDTRANILCIIVSIWAVRLALHIGIRNHGKGEDYRYIVFRQQGGKNYWWISYLRVFVLQGFLMWIIASPLLIAQTYRGDLSTLDYIGLLIWLTGFLFEFIGDWQLAHFKQNPTNKGQVMNRGLWRYTRHPNYFGDALLWWGYFCFALASSEGLYYIFSPLLMTFLLMKVSGVSLLEKTLVKTKPKYEEYCRKTSAFFPMLPKQ